MTASTLAARRDSPFRRVVVDGRAAESPRCRSGGSSATLPGQARRSWYMAFNQLPGLPERSLDRLVPKLGTTGPPGTTARADVADAPGGAPRSGSPARGRQLLPPPRPALPRAAALPPLAGGPHRPPGHAAALPHGRDDACWRRAFAEIAAVAPARGFDVRVVDRRRSLPARSSSPTRSRLVVEFLTGCGDGGYHVVLGVHVATCVARPS